MRTLFNRLFIILFLFACTTSEENNNSVATVGSSSLSPEDLSHILPENINSFSSSDEIEPYVDRWVQKELLYLAAVEEKLHQDAELSQRVEDFRKSLLGNVYLEMYISNKVFVTSDEIRDYYEKNRDSFVRVQTSARLLHFLLNNESEAINVKKELLLYDGSVRKSLIDKYDVSVDLVSPKEIIPEISNVIFRKGSGKGVFGPIKSNFGYHVVEVLERFPPNSIRGLDEVYEEIYQRIVEQKSNSIYRFLIDSLSNNYGVKTDINVFLKGK